jgi:lipopolysaccharide/colanic/teichoic acid biosynthesis glycosyltransferase
MRAVIFATGESEGLAPLSEQTPVPLLPLVDRPVIQHVVEALVHRNVRDIHFVLSHLPEKVEAFLGDGARWGCRFTFHLARDPHRPYRLLRYIDLGSDTDLVGHADRLAHLPVDICDAPAPRLLFWTETESGKEPQRHWAGWALLSAASLANIPGEPDEEGFARWLFDRHPGSDAYSEVPPPIPLRSFPEYFAAHEAVLSKKSLTPLSPGREVEPGVWLGRNVSLHPTARVQPPVFVGANSVVGPGVTLGPYAVIGQDCMLDARSTVVNSLVFPGSYVGESLELADVVVDRQVLVNPQFEEAITIPDPLLLGSLSEVGVVPPLQRLLSRLVAAVLLVLSFPLMLLTVLYLKASRPGPVLYWRRVMRLPAGGRRTQTFDLFSFRPETGWNCSDCSLRGLLFQFLPALVNVARGELSFVGVPPRSPEEVDRLPADWRKIYLRSKAGIVSDSSFLIGAALGSEELFTTEAYYSWAASWRYDLRVVIRYLLRSLAGPLASRFVPDLSELRTDVRHFTHLLALPTGEAQRKELAIVRDISRTGVGLESTHDYQPGARLTAELYNPRRHTARLHELVVRHATTQSNGKFLLGCRFVAPLREEDLAELR